MHSEKYTGTIESVASQLYHTLYMWEGLFDQLYWNFFFYSTKLFIVFHLKKTNAPDVSPVSLISPVGKN